MKSRHLIIGYLSAIMAFGIGGCSRQNADVKNQGQTPQASVHAGHTAAKMEEMQPDTIRLSKRDEQYANITVDTVRFKNIAEYTTLLGSTNFDERKIIVVTSRIRGRIDHLFVRNLQQWVGSGEPLYAIYSEELQSYENELLNALQQQATFSEAKQLIDQLVDGARRKLALWGLTKEKIALLEQTRVASALDTFYSPISGTLTGLDITEGQYVETGTPLFKIADLSKLWIESQMYTGELQWLYQKPSITAEFDAYPGQEYTVTPVFDNPVVEPNQKISLVRFLVNNNHQLKPGMMAYVNIKRNEKRALVIPKSSLLIGKMITVWVHTGTGIYENRTIELGIQNKKETEVVHGLEAGDIVVTNGAFLLNSALILRKGSGMGGMKM